MATLIDRSPAPTVPVGVVHAVLGVLATADTWRGEPTTDTLERLLEVVSPEDAGYLPAAVGECLSALRGDADEFTLALDLIKAFDLYEAAPGLAAVLREAPSRTAIETAAAMAPHPAVSSLLGELAGHAVSEADDVPPGLSARVRMLVSGSLPSGAGDADAWLFAERWPGRVNLAQATAPIIGVCDDAGPPARTLEFVLALRRAGAQVRRLPARPMDVPEGWLPGWAVLVGGRRPPWWLPERPFRSTDGSLGTGGQRDLLRWLVRELKGPLALRTSGPESGWDGPLGDPFLDAGTFLDGALRVPEVSFLTGWSGQTVRRRGCKHAKLQPRFVSRSGLPVYGFGQLTALRVERYMSHHFGRRSDPGLAAQLVSLVEGEHAVPTHVTTDGRILFEQDPDTVFDPSGQTALKAIGLGEIARSFELGSGRTVPELLTPSVYTQVHPSVQRGTPVAEGTRISATAVRDVAARGRSGGHRGADLTDFVLQCLPELGPQQVSDVEQVGQRIFA